MRNIAIFTLAVLSVSFIYIGYTGFDDSSEKLKPTVNMSEVVEEWSTLAINTPDIDSSDKFFVEFRMQRDRARAAQIELLRDNVNNPKSSQETINKAQEKIFLISQNIASEAQAENLLKAKGYEKSAVFVEDENITVVVKKEDLSEVDIVRIGDLVMRATGCTLEQIVITQKD